MLEEEACLDPVGVCFPDLMEEAALPVADAADLIAAIAGALSSTSQLHYLRSVTKPTQFPLWSYPEEFPQRRIVGLARLALDILQILREPEAQHLKHAVKLIVRVANGDKCIGLIQVIPVLEVGRRFQQLSREGEAYRCNVCYTNKPAISPDTISLLSLKARIPSSSPPKIKIL